MPLTQELLAAALVGLEAQKQRIDGQIAEVRALLGKRGPGRPPASQSAGAPPAPRKRRKRKLSPEGRAAIIAATKKRWAAYKKQKVA
jgi:hypothetical protein